MVNEIDIQDLKAAEKKAETIEIPRAGNKRKKNKHHKKKDLPANACGWHYNHAAGWGLSLLAVGLLALAAVLGYSINWWALFLLLPGISGIISGIALARWQSGQDWQSGDDWVFWPLFGGLMMTIGGISWSLGFSWQISLALILIGSGGILLWLSDARRNQVA